MPARPLVALALCLAALAGPLAAEPPAAPLQVWVTDPDGQPVPDAAVTLDLHLPSGAQRAKTGPDGLASFPAAAPAGGLPVAPAADAPAGDAARRSVHVAAPGVDHAPLFFQDVRAWPLSVLVAPREVLSGRVVDAAGEPVPGPPASWSSGGTAGRATQSGRRPRR